MNQLEGRNPVIEVLQRGRRAVHRIWLDAGAREDRRVSRILELAGQKGVPVKRVPRHDLDKMSEGRVHNGVIAHADALPQYNTKALLADLTQQGVRDPFLIVCDEIQYEHNLGAILRSALGFGAHGIIIPTRRGADPSSPVVQRVSMGGIEAVPVVREGLHSALKHVRNAGIPIVGADMGGTVASEHDLTGALAIVMGSEGRGLSKTLRDKCDAIIAVPLAGGLESLNVSVSAAVLMYEKRRQDAI